MTSAAFANQSYSDAAYRQLTADAHQSTEAVYRRLKDRYRFVIRGPVEIKGKGVMQTYFLQARNDPPQEAAHATVGEATSATAVRQQTENWTTSIHP